MFQFMYKQSQSKRIALPVKNQSGKNSYEVNFDL